MKHPITGEQLPDNQVLRISRDMDLLQTALQAVEADLETEGWDQPPGFYVVIENDEVVGLEQIDMPEHFYDHPPSVLPQLYALLVDTDDQLGVAARHHFRQILNRGFAGLALTWEGWTVPTPEDESSPEFAAWTRAQQNNEFHLHPDRSEERWVSAFMVNGREVGTRRIRGEFPATFEINEPGGETPQFGRIPTAMRGLVKVFKGLAEETV